MPPPQREIPLFKHLREIADGTRPKPQTRARRHHYIPSFLLARWAMPQGQRQGKLFELLVPGGRPRTTTPDRSAFRRDLYAQDVGEASPDLTFEAYLSIIENYAAEPLKRLAGLPSSISDDDRAVIACFVAHQEARTPPALAQHRINAFQAAQFALAEFIGDWNEFAKRYRDEVDADATDETIAAFRATATESFAAGDHTIEVPAGAVLHAMTILTPQTAAVIATQDWTILRATDAEFITNDRGIAMFDPTPRFPWSGNAWLSSPNAEATMPLGPDACLRMTPGEERFSTRTVEATVVEEINLRTYGWAEQSIFGTSQEAVVQVHRVAKRDRRRVPRPRIPRQVVVEPADPDDKTAGADNARRGWPRLLARSDGSGRREVLTYKVLERGNGVRAGTLPKPEILNALQEAFEKQSSI
jgi:hypothetical protein